jgi:hypothetical protein
MSVEIKAYIDELLKYLDIYESNNAALETAAFLQTYNGVYTVFQALRQQRDKAIEVDQYFLDKIRAINISSSDLRQLTIQVLITYFESEADTDGQSNRAYSYIRNQRPVKRDASYFEDHLVPLLFKDDSLNGNERLNEFFLNEIARFMNKFGSPLNTNLSPEEFNAMNDPKKLLELARRRQALGAELVGDRNSLEYELRSLNVFNKLAEKSHRLDWYFSHWQYHVKVSFWSTLADAMSSVWSKFIGAFSSLRYLRLVLNQRNGAYIFYSIVILIFVFLAVFVPIRWNSYSRSQYEKMQERASELQIDVNK